MKRIAVLFLLGVVLISGCATVDCKEEYIEPASVLFKKNSVIINKPKAEVWKQLIPGLGSTFFVINNIDKESGLINISYKGDPERLLDCGDIKKEFKNIRGTQKFDFPAAKDFQRYLTVRNGYTFNVERKMDLEGRMNIIVQELTPQSTKVTVNAKYVVTKDVKFYFAGRLEGRDLDTINFNSGQQGCFEAGTTCQSNGVFEQEVLSVLLNIKKQ